MCNTFSWFRFLCAEISASIYIYIYICVCVCVCVCVYVCVCVIQDEPKKIVLG